MNERVYPLIFATASLLVLGAVVFGMASCVQRDWNFEDACRRAGGIVVDASRVSSAGGARSTDVCAKVVQSPLLQPIELPNYHR